MPKKKQSKTKRFFNFIIRFIFRSLWKLIKLLSKGVWGLAGLIVKLYDLIANSVRQRRESNEEENKNNKNGKEDHDNHIHIKHSNKHSKQLSKHKPKETKLKVIKTFQGDLNKWINKIKDSDSTIGIILGARGTGKSAFGMRFLENMKTKTNKQCYAMGFKETPGWITIVESIEELNNDAFVLIDEGGILFSSRNAMSNANKLLSELILVARHKNLSILFISQNSSNLDVNIIRQADYLVLKPSSLLQKDFERKKIKDVYQEVEEHFKEYKDERGLTYIYSETFRGFVSNSLPSFWSEGLSKSFG